MGPDNVLRGVLGVHAIWRALKGPLHLQVRILLSTKCNKAFIYGIALQGTSPAHRLTLFLFCCLALTVKKQ